MRELIEAAKRREPAALEELIASHLPSLRAFVRLRVDALLRQRESCSDLVQSACRDALEGLDAFEYRGESSFRSWLYTLTLNKIRQRREHWLAEKRDPAREQQFASGAHWSRILPGPGAPDGTASQVVIAQETAERIEAAFDRLPDGYREVLALSRILGMSNAEIAELTGRQEGAVRTQLSRALVRLSELLLP